MCARTAVKADALCTRVSKSLMIVSYLHSSKPPLSLSRTHHPSPLCAISSNAAPSATRNRCELRSHRMPIDSCHRHKNSRPRRALT